MYYLQIFDGVVVMATCVIYVCLTVVISKHLLAYSLSYIIVLRLWRLGRLYNGLYHGRRLLKTFVGAQLPLLSFHPLIYLFSLRPPFTHLFTEKNDST